MKSARILEAAWLTDFDRRPSRHRKHRSMQFSECQPADGISAAAQNGNFGLSCGAALLPSYNNTLVAGCRLLALFCVRIAQRPASGYSITFAVLNTLLRWSKLTRSRPHQPLLDRSKLGNVDFRWPNRGWRCTFARPVPGSHLPGLNLATTLVWRLRCRISRRFRLPRDGRPSTPTACSSIRCRRQTG